MQRYFAKGKMDNHFILGDDDLYHIKTVMRMKDNDLIEVVYENRLFHCCIENVKSNIKIIIKKEIKNIKNNVPKVTLIIPLLKENKMDLILQKATEMGVYKFIVLPFNRCVIKALEKKKNNRIDRWKRIVKEASEQSKRVNIPEIEFKDKLTDLKKLDDICLTCSTKEKQKNLKRVLTKNKNCDRINLVIGPEGGLTNEEEDYLDSIGFQRISLGNQILRVETVPLFLMSIIDYEYME